MLKKYIVKVPRKEYNFKFECQQIDNFISVAFSRDKSFFAGEFIARNLQHLFEEIERISNLSKYLQEDLDWIELENLKQQRELVSCPNQE